MNHPTDESAGGQLPTPDATELLRELFSIVPADVTTAWIASFKTDPAKATNRDWAGHAHDPTKPLPPFNGANAYHSISAFRHGVAGRRTDQQHAVLVLVLDDVGTKADPEHCHTTLGDPSYIMETSAANFQWGYLPDKPLTAAEIEPLHEAIKALKAADGSGINSVRYVRLPTGTNTKEGKGNFAVRMAEWHPERRYSLAYFQERLKVKADERKKSGYDSPESVGDGLRNETLAQHAGYLIDKGITGENGRRMLHDFNRARCNPPKSDDEVDTVWKSINKTHKRKRAAEAEAADTEEIRGVDPRLTAQWHAQRPDVYILPSDYVSFTASAQRIFRHMGKERHMFVRGGQAVEVVGNDLTMVEPHALRSRLDKRSRRVLSAAVIGHRQDLAFKPKRCSLDHAQGLLKTTEVQECLPPIDMVAHAPVLIEVDGLLQVLGHGYHEAGGGIMVFAKGTPPEVPLETAVPALLSLLEEFKFQTPGDQSRAVANIVGPALRTARLLPGHALMNIIEADESQAGKGYLAESQRAVYAEPGYVITQISGGVGSLDERIAAGLFSGSPCLVLDNVKGRIQSAYLEALLTLPDDGHAPVRLPHKPQLSLDIRRVTFTLTSNGYEATVDLANRSMMTRIFRQAGRVFKTYPEGGLLQHIQGNQLYYLACVFAVVKHWHAQGKPRLPTIHTFREWVGALDWIVRQVFKLAPLLDGHEQAVARVMNPALSWLRLLAAEVIRTGNDFATLSASRLAELSDTAGIAMPGERGERGAHLQVGALMAQCFRESDKLELDGIIIQRLTDAHEWSERGLRKVVRYEFSRVGQDHPGEIEA